QLTLARGGSIFLSSGANSTWPTNIHTSRAGLIAHTTLQENLRLLTSPPLATVTQNLLPKPNACCAKTCSMPGFHAPSIRSTAVFTAYSPGSGNQGQARANSLCFKGA